MDVTVIFVEVWNAMNKIFLETQMQLKAVGEWIPPWHMQSNFAGLLGVGTVYACIIQSNFGCNCTMH